MGRDGLADRLLDVGRPRHVAGNERRGATTCAYLVDDRYARRRGAGGDHDVGARVGEGEGEPAPDTSAGPGDEHGSTCHVVQRLGVLVVIGHGHIKPPPSTANVAPVSGAASLPASSATTGSDRYGYNNSRDGYYSSREARREAREARREARYLRDNDVIYRDANGRYYCKRDDGTTGTIVGAIGGGVLGNIIAPGGSKTLGTIIGAAGGAIAGRAIDKSDARCE